MAHETRIDPVVLCEGDPSAQDESLPTRIEYGNYQSFSGIPPEKQCSAAAYTALVGEFDAALAAWLSGDGPLGKLESLLGPLGVQPGIKHDRRGLLVAPVELPDSVLADVAEDEVPDAAVLVERVTGNPFSPLTVGILAALAWAPAMDEPRQAVDAWAEDETERSLVIAMRVIERAPPSVYVNGASILPLNPRMCPPSVPPGCFVARAYPLAQGWAFSSRVDLPGAPRAEPLIERLMVELWRLRLRERRASWEDVLRLSPLLVYRAAHEGAQVGSDVAEQRA